MMDVIFDPSYVCIRRPRCHTGGGKGGGTGGLKRNLTRPGTAEVSKTNHFIEKAGSMSAIKAVPIEHARMQFLEIRLTVTLRVLMLLLYPHTLVRSGGHTEVALPESRLVNVKFSKHGDMNINCN